jgi:hypothetical protein
MMLLILKYTFLFLCAPLSHGGSRNPPMARSGEKSLSPHYSQYFYSSLKEKLKESSVKSNPCAPLVDIMKQSRVITPHNHDKSYWSSIRNTLRYYKVSQSLCDNRQYSSYVSSISPLCQQPIKEGYIGGKGHFHPSHPRCQPFSAKPACPHNKAALIQSPPVRYSFDAYPFIINISALIHISSSGMLYTKCEVVGLFASCKSSSTGLVIALKERDESFANSLQHDKCMSSFVRSPQRPTASCPYSYHPRVFITSQYDDTQVGQVSLSPSK